MCKRLSSGQEPAHRTPRRSPSRCVVACASGRADARRRRRACPLSSINVLKIASTSQVKISQQTYEYRALQARARAPQVRAQAPAVRLQDLRRTMGETRWREAGRARLNSFLAPGIPVPSMGESMR